MQASPKGFRLEDVVIREINSPDESFSTPLIALASIDIGFMRNVTAKNLKYKGSFIKLSSINSMTLEDINVESSTLNQGNIFSVENTNTVEINGGKFKDLATVTGTKSTLFKYETIIARDTDVKSVFKNVEFTDS